MNPKKLLAHAAFTLGLLGLAAASGCGSSPFSAPDTQADAASWADTDAGDGGNEAALDPDGSVLEAGGCPAGTADCDGDPGNGCEAKIDSDAKNCGACKHDCTGLPHVSGKTTCAAGKCVVPTTSCAAGFAHCSMNADDGCEADLSKPATCGTCSTACSGTTPVCSTGMCSNGCSGTTPTLCSGSCVDTTKSATNCGGCGNACPVPSHGQATCATSACGFSCNSGYHACGMACADNTDPLTCGSACTPCAVPANARATCDGTSCGFACNAGYHKCGSTCSRDDDATACGLSCTVCTVPGGAGHAMCSGASCGIACDSGNHLCGTTCDSNASVATCGSSCTPCAAPGSNGHATCDGTSCGIACDPSYHQCGNGCSSNNSIASCGASCTPCPSRANAQTTCNGVACGYTCNAGFADCDGSAANGCEVNLTNDGGNCNTCGHSCLGGACTSRACQPVTLANAPNAQAIAIDANNVYYAYGSLAGAVTKNGASIGTVAPQGTVSDIAVDANGVYLADITGAIWKVTKTFSSLPMALFSMSGFQPLKLTVVNDVVYFTEADHNAIYYVSTSGGSTINAYVLPSPYSSTMTVGDIAADNSAFIWAESNISAGRVMSAAGGFGAPPALGWNQHETSCVALDASYFYWGNFSSGDIWSAPRNPPGSNGSPLIAGEGSINDLAVDAAGLYWASSVPGRVRKSALDGTNVTTVWSGGSAAGVAVDAVAIYWTDSQNGRVMKLAK